MHLPGGSNGTACKAQCNSVLGTVGTDKRCIPFLIPSPQCCLLSPLQIVQATEKLFGSGVTHQPIRKMYGPAVADRWVPGFEALGPAWLQTGQHGLWHTPASSSVLFLSSVCIHPRLAQKQQDLSALDLLVADATVCRCEDGEVTVQLNGGAQQQEVKVPQGHAQQPAEAASTQT